MHRHVVHDPVIELDVRVLFGDLLGNLQEETVGELHDVRLVDRGHLAAAVGARVNESEVDDSGAGRHRDGLDTEPGVWPNRFSGSCANPLNHVAGLGFSFLELDAGVDVLGVLPDDDQVDVVVPRADPRIALAGANQGIEIELFAERDVHRSDPLPNRRCQRPLDRHLVPTDRLEHRRRHRGAVLLHDAESRILDVPFELDARRLQHAAGRFADFRTDPIAGDQGHAMRQNASMLPAGGYVSLLMWRRRNSRAARSKRGLRVRWPRRTTGSGSNTPGPKTGASWNG